MDRREVRVRDQQDVVVDPHASAVTNAERSGR